jgi:iron complex outermembrane recepter protein
VTYRPPSWGRWHSTSATVAGTYTAQQTRYDLATDFSPPPPGYFVVDADVGTETAIAGNTLKISLNGSNVLGSRYRDYTSLLRYFVDQPTWQVALRLSVHFGLDEQH